MPPGLKPKDLVGVPWMVAFALRAAGWYLRSEVIWFKPNPMPESVADRPTKAHETVFLLAKSRIYFYDAAAIREEAEYGRREQPADTWRRAGIGAVRVAGVTKGCDQSAGRNKRSVWEIATAPFREAHFATFPPKLIEPMIKSGTSERGCCLVCQAPWERAILSIKTIGWRPTCAHYDDRYRAECPQARSPRKRAQRAAWGDWWRRTRRRPGNPAWSTRPAVVLDPFGGSGTTALVAERLGRDSMLIDLNTQYAKMAVDRISREAPLFNMIETA